jgi:hypothetical protein
MITGRFNIVLGLGAMIAAALVGLALGLTLEPYFASGYAQIPFWRYLTRVAHTHGVPFGLINILFGLLIERATCSLRLKRFGAAFTALALCLPVGGGLRGVTQGALWAEGLAMIGGVSLLAACVSMIIMVNAARKG